jgi:hypothetical protein
MEYIGMDVRIILKLILKKKNKILWTGFARLGTGTIGGDVMNKEMNLSVPYRGVLASSWSRLISC